jgi:hypothetical protein
VVLNVVEVVVDKPQLPALNVVEEVVDGGRAAEGASLQRAEGVP